MAVYNGHSLICDYLDELGVPNTPTYSNQRFDSMPFPTMFGLVKLLQEYGVESKGYLLNDKRELAQLTTPFLAITSHGTVIVTSTNGGTVNYISQGIQESAPADEFAKGWTGKVVLSFPSPSAAEPDYSFHARIEFLMKAKKWVLAACAVFLFAYFFISNRLYDNVGIICVTIVDLFGLYISYMLVQKSVNIHTKAADSLCSVIQKGGCDHILASDASKFFGLFGWSEVGFAYFSVSLLALLLFPSTLPSLAAINICCLPFPFWSVWYQKFRAHHWCTLCLCVQASLWLLFFSYLAGGFVKQIFPLSFDIILMGAAYVGVMLGVNALMPLMSRANPQR